MNNLHNRTSTNAAQSLASPIYSKLGKLFKLFNIYTPTLRAKSVRQHSTAIT